MGERQLCEQNARVSEWMSLALDGMLDDAGLRRMRDHLDACGTCRAEWIAMQQVSGWLAQAPMAGPSLGFAVRVQRRLEERAPHRQRLPRVLPSRTARLSLLGAAAGAFGLSVLAVVAWKWLGSLSSVQLGRSALSQVASGLGLVGKGAQLFLADVLQQYGLPVMLGLCMGLALGMGAWLWLFQRQVGNSNHNGFV